MGSKTNVEFKFGVVDKDGEIQEIKNIGEFLETVMDDLTSCTEQEECCDAELEEIKPDGINIHISGADIDKISNVEIYFKEGE